MLMWEAYDPSSIPSPLTPGFVWKPVGEAGAVPSGFQVPGSSSPLGSGAFGPVASMDWFPYGGSCYLVTSMIVGKTPTLFVNQMASSSSYPSDVQLPVPSGGVYSTLVVVPYAAALGPIMVARDPACRMTLCTYAGAKSAAQTLTVPNAADPFGSSSAWTAAWFGATGWTTPLLAYSTQPAVTTWVLGQTYNDSNGLPSQDIFQAYLFLGPNGEVCADIKAFGTAQYIENAMSGKLLPCPTGDPPCAPVTGGKTYTGIVSGIIDAPFPMPASNIKSNKLKPGTSLGTVTYGVTQSSDKDHSSNLSVGAGFTTSSTTTSGFGPNWSVSLDAAKTQGSGHDVSTGLVTNSWMETCVSSDGSSVTPNGSVFASNVAYIGTYYRVLDVNGNAFSEGGPGGQPPPTCPIMYSITAYPQGSQAITYPPYLVTPGDLASYTREAINAQAIKIGLAAPGSDYIAEVIQANALQLAPNLNYLEWSQSGTAFSSTSYLTSTTDWTETGWTMNFSDYVGGGGGGGVSVLGVQVASVELSAMAGINVSASQSTTTSQSTAVQLVVSDTALPQARKGTDIVQLSVQIYFLPANALWMTEVVKYSGLSFTDTNSQPWRIFFLVTSYKSQDGTISYP